MNVLVTGGNRGIGRATVAALAERGEVVTFTARDVQRGETALAELRAAYPKAEIRLEIADLSRPASIRDLAGRLIRRGEPLHGLINNAGVLRAPATRALTPEGVEVTLATNAFGPWLLTRELTPLLAAAPRSRVIGLGSRLHRPDSRGDDVDFDFEDPQMNHDYSQDRAYKNSKLALLWVTRWLSQMLPSTVDPFVVCPGLVPLTAAQYASGPVQRFLLRHVLRNANFTHTPAEAGEILVWALEAAELDGARGSYLEDQEVVEPSPQAQSDADAAHFVRLVEKWSRNSAVP